MPLRSRGGNSRPDGFGKCRPCGKRLSAQKEIQTRLQNLSAEVDLHLSSMGPEGTSLLAAGKAEPATALAYVTSTCPLLIASAEFFVYGSLLALSTIRWFRFGIVAVVLGFRLIVYALLLLPAFLQVAYAYFHDGRILRSIRFGKEPRNYLDIYRPLEALEGPVPVVVAIMGGAWIMGHRAWNAQLGLRLMDAGVMLVAVDYRNFPQGCVPDMIEDIGRGLSWVFANIGDLGGDVGNTMLLAQSAGAHLAALLLLDHSLLEVSATRSPGSGSADQDGPATLPEWSVQSLKGFLGVSGIYDLPTLAPHLATRGIHPRILNHLTLGDLAGCSPARVLDNVEERGKASEAAARLPPIYLLHGQADKSAPCWSSEHFGDVLRRMGATSVTVDLRASMTHTFPVIEGPLKGLDPQVELVLPMLFDQEGGRRLASLPPMRPLFPAWYVDLVARIMPY